MKILIIDILYENFIRQVYSVNKRLEYESYDIQSKNIIDSFFGIINFYTKNLIKSGCESHDHFFNILPLQIAWAKEQGFRNVFYSQWPYMKNTFLVSVLKKRIRELKPDVLFVHDFFLEDDFIREIRKDVKLVVGQIANSYPKDLSIKEYDLALSSVPPFVDRFRKDGLNSEYLKLGFESEILNFLDKTNFYEYDCSFVGGLTNFHTQRIDILKKLLKDKNNNISLWGYTDNKNRELFKDVLKGEVWGKDMYNIFKKSKITLNIHIDSSGKYANNMRLYEATGCGTLLITDEKNNLGELFEIDKEVVTYKNVEELKYKIKYFLNNEEERLKIALAGQKRTLTEHTYFNRMKDLIGILEKYL